MNNLSEISNYSSKQWCENRMSHGIWDELNGRSPMPVCLSELAEIYEVQNGTASRRHIQWHFTMITYLLEHGTLELPAGISIWCCPLTTEVWYNFCHNWCHLAGGGWRREGKLGEVEQNNWEVQCFRCSIANLKLYGSVYCINPLPLIT